MPIFSYKAKDDKGLVYEDTIQASSKAEAVVSIKARELQILTIKNLEVGISGIFSGRISVSEKAAFARFLATMLRSGMSLTEAVEIMKEETKNKKMRKILTNISAQTRKGKSLSAVLSMYKKDFDQIFLTMVKAGEQSGTLEKSFDYLADQLTASHELAQKIKGSLTYPIVIVIAMLGNGILMGVFVLPRISQAFLKLQIDLPFYTKALLTVGDFIGKNVVLFFAGVALVVALGIFTIIFNPTRQIILRVLAKLPVISKIIKHIDIARFARTLSTLMKSGVSIIDALDVSADTLSQSFFKRSAKKFGESVAKGRSLSEVMVENRKTFPPVMIQTIRAGEESGTLEEVLAEMASFYEKEIDYSLKRLTSLLEPVLMLIIGVVVGVMVIIMIAPIYSIIGGLQSATQR